MRCRPAARSRSACRLNPIVWRSMRSSTPGGSTIRSRAISARMRTSTVKPPCTLWLTWTMRPRKTLCSAISSCSSASSTSAWSRSGAISSRESELPIPWSSVRSSATAGPAGPRRSTSPLATQTILRSATVTVVYSTGPGSADGPWLSGCTSSAMLAVAVHRGQADDLELASGLGPPRVEGELEVRPLPLSELLTDDGAGRSGRRQGARRSSATAASPVPARSPAPTPGGPSARWRARAGPCRRR